MPCAMKPVPLHTFAAIPSLPASLEKLRELAFNVRWSWSEDALDLFRRLGAELWTTSGHNPVALLGTISQDLLAAAEQDEGFKAHLARVCAEQDTYMTKKATWFQQHHDKQPAPLVAYFSAEFGVTECLPIFAGGLGALAGDHLKSASDMGIPIVGVGLLYQQGYFRQHLNRAGWQQETYQENDFSNLPLHLECDNAGTPLTISVGYPGREVFARIWRLQVGRVPLYLLDTNFSANVRDEDRDLTDYLYGGGDELRIRQEILLGIGGYRALTALGLVPTVYHVNEGHSAFLVLERIRQFMHEKGLSFDEARVATSASVIFTTHTPVEAGHDRFGPELMDRYMVGYANNELGISRREFLGLGRVNADNDHEPFGMTRLALRVSAHNNGVARLHGAVSRKMWQCLWPELPEEEVPIGHVTNGIHVASWLSSELKQLFDRYLGPRWRSEPGDAQVWSRVEQIPSAALWRTKTLRRERLVELIRRRVPQQLRRTGAPQNEVEAAEGAFDANTLTIGFARRFATYKRATLLFSDPDRLARILTSKDCPVQIVFSGKAHPKDHPGKELIQRIVTLAREEPFRRSIVFLEDYDMAITRTMVQGADVWLNTPRRPREASGTSGMKAAVNGCLNVSILDGWWDEAYRPELGWAIGSRETYEDQSYQDSVEADHLYDLLEHDVIPLFYQRSPEGLPLKWIRRMKGSVSEYAARFNAHRMVREYYDRAYEPAARKFAELSSDDMRLARELAAWSQRMRHHWEAVSVALGDGETGQKLQVGEQFRVQASVNLGALQPDDVEVQVYMGRVTASGRIVEPNVHSMHMTRGADGEFTFCAEGLTCRNSGLHGYTVRVLPRHRGFDMPFLQGRVVWAAGQ